MYTNFIKSFNNFFGKKGNYLFSTILIIFSILLMLSSIYALNNITVRNTKYNEKFIIFENDRGYFIGENGREEVTFLSYNDGKELNPLEYNNKILKMYCLKNDQKNCFYVKNIYSYNYVLLGLATSIVLLSLGIVCHKLYKARNTNHGSIRILRPFLVTLFIFGAYLFTYQIYNLVSYMRFQNNTMTTNGTIIGTYTNKYLTDYVVDEKHYCTLINKKNENKVKYNIKNPSISYDKSNFNILFLTIGIAISYTSMMFMISEKNIDKKIKIIEKKSKKESYRRKK